MVQEGALAVHCSAGLASLDLGVPIGPQTSFRIASVSKQFTCAAILMLAAEGKLGLDDRLCDHLPAMPDQGVTIRHLLHNTSGIRDMLEIMRHGGADLGTPVDAAALMAGIARQRTLNFAPNTQFLYSNSNFLLLGRIAERVSGEALGAWLQRRLFAPLGLTRTRLTESVADPAPGLATGYFPSPGGFVRAAHAFPLHGEGGLVSGVEDLALWASYLDGEGRALAGELAQGWPFENGEPNFYARGQTVRLRRGVATVSHGGLWPGFKTEFLRAPELGLTVIAISNDGGADPNGLGVQVLDMLLDGRPGIAPVPRRPAREAAERLAGRWVSPDAAATLDAAVVDGGLELRANGVPVKPSLRDDGWIGTVHGSTALAVRGRSADELEVEHSAGLRAVWHRARPGALPAGLAGSYASDEMASRWVIAEAEGRWSVQASGPVATSPAAWPLIPVEGELMRVEVPGALFAAWLDVRAVVEGGAVTGLVVNGGRAKQVRYRRE